MYYNIIEQGDNIIVEPDMEPVVVYYTQNPEVNEAGEGENQGENDDDNNIDNNNNDDDDDSGIQTMPEECFDAETEPMGNTSHTKAGRISRPPPRLIESINMAQAINDLAERFYDAMRELNELDLIGAQA
jgi:hypothetical protein